MGNEDGSEVEKSQTSQHQSYYKICQLYYHSNMKQLNHATDDIESINKALMIKMPETKTTCHKQIDATPTQASKWS